MNFNEINNFRLETFGLPYLWQIDLPREDIAF